jgi:hypothetical protein
MSSVRVVPSYYVEYYVELYSVFVVDLLKVKGNVKIMECEVGAIIFWLGSLMCGSDEFCFLFFPPRIFRQKLEIAPF